MTQNARFLLDMLQKNQVAKKTTYREGIFTFDTNTKEYNAAWQELITEGFLNSSGGLTNSGKRYFYMPNPKTLNESLVQGVATNCINELAQIVAEKGWTLNAKFTEAITNLVTATQKAEALLAATSEPKEFNIFTPDTFPELEEEFEIKVEFPHSTKKKTKV